MTNKDVMIVMQTLNKVFGINKIQSIVRMGGMTNRTYLVDKEYVVRIPGDGTEQLINRDDERKSTELACDLDIDSKLLYFDDEGIKVTKYIKNSTTITKDILHKNNSLINDMSLLLKKLHSSNRDTGVDFDVFNMASNYEKIIYSNQVQLFSDYEDVKKIVFSIKNQISNISDKKVPCHNDPLCENWIYDGERLYLIDWEYAGMNDYMWDLADISIEADFDDKSDKILLESYLLHSITRENFKHFLANKIFIDYLWCLWGKTRVPFDGESLNQYAENRYNRLKQNIKKYNNLNTD